MGVWHKVVEFSIDWKEKTYTAQVMLEIVTDANYGADADGNRGCFREAIEECSVKHVVDSKGRTAEISDEFYESICEQAGKMDISDEPEQEEDFDNG